MTRRALRSAVLEVGLFYEKGWPADRIAWFAQHLARRRLREQAAAARAQKTAQAPQAEQPMVAFGISPSSADTRTETERLVDRVRADLSKSISDDEQTDAMDRSEESVERAAPTRAG